MTPPILIPFKYVKRFEARPTTTNALLLTTDGLVDARQSSFKKLNNLWMDEPNCRTA